MAKVVAITGANGFLGSALTSYLSSNGWRIIALVRNPEQFKTNSNIEYRQYDMKEPLSSGLLKNVDYLVHAAYIKEGYSDTQIIANNVKAAEAILKSSAHHSIKRCVFISSMSAHKEATSSYGKQKQRIERLFLNHNGLVLRPGLIIGNGGVIGNISKFIKTKHVVPLIRGGTQPVQIVGIDDLVIAIEHSFSIKESAVLTVASTEIYTYRQLTQSIADRIKSSVFFVSLPTPLLFAVIKILSFLKLSQGINLDNLRGLQNLQSADSQPDLAKLRIKVHSLPIALKRNLS